MTGFSRHVPLAADWHLPFWRGPDWMASRRFAENWNRVRPEPPCVLKGLELSYPRFISTAAGGNRRRARNVVGKKTASNNCNRAQKSLLTAHVEVGKTSDRRCECRCLSRVVFGEIRCARVFACGATVTRSSLFLLQHIPFGLGLRLWLCL